MLYSLAAPRSSLLTSSRAPACLPARFQSTDVLSTHGTEESAEGKPVHFKRTADAALRHRPRVRARHLAVIGVIVQRVAGVGLGWACGLF